MGITKQCLSNKPEIVETIGFPVDILALDDLISVLNKETSTEPEINTEIKEPEIGAPATESEEVQ